MNNILKEKLPEFFSFFPDLYPLIVKLNENNYKWLIGGSGCLFLYGNERKPDDVDILLPNDQHDLVDQLFAIESYTYNSVTEFVRNSNPNNDHDLQFTSNLEITVDNKKYTFDYGTFRVQERASSSLFHGQLVRIAPPEEVLIVKAILQRGKSEGKHDLEDIERFLEIDPNIDKGYLKRRIASLEAKERVGNIFEGIDS